MHVGICAPSALACNATAGLHHSNHTHAHSVQLLLPHHAAVGSKHRLLYKGPHGKMQKDGWWQGMPSACMLLCKVLAKKQCTEWH